MSAQSSAREASAPVSEAPASKLQEVALAPAPQPRRKRPSRRLVLMVALPAALVAAGGYMWLTGGRYVATDNAYLQQNKVSIAADVSGRIVALSAAENAPVHRGDIVLKIDPAPFRIAVQQAEAAVGSARLQVEQLRAAIREASAEVKSNEDKVAYLTAAFERQQNLLKTGVASRAAFDQAQNAVQTAEQDLAQSKQKVEGALAALGGDQAIATDAHPLVLSAIAQLDKAKLDLANTEVRAPADGVYSQTDNVHVGQYVTAATPLLALVETGDSWVEANFKETDLTHMQVGQTATISLDAYPDHEFTARVESIGAGTGSAFSLLPAQNATGNWVKVVQRVPVRLRIDGDAVVPLRTGLSASVEVDTQYHRALPGFVRSALAFGQTRKEVAAH